MTGCSSKPSYEDYGRVSMSASWSNYYGSVEELAKASDIVAVIKTTGAECSTQQGIHFTTYDAQVKQLVYGTDEKNIQIFMTGGIDEKEKMIYELSDDPLMQINNEFLIFARKNDNGTYTILSGPQGRFEIKDGRVYSLNEINVQMKKASVGSNTTVNGMDKEEFFRSVKEYTA